MPKNSPLPLRLSKQSNQKENGARMAASPQSASPRSPPASGGSGESEEHNRSFYVEPTPTAAEFFPASHSPESPRHKKESSRSIFPNSKASKSSTRINPSEASIRQVSDSRSESVKSQVYPYRQSPGSSPELGKSMESASIASVSSSIPDSTNPRIPPATSVKSHSLPYIDTDLPSSNKRGNAKGRFPNILSRTRSTSTKGFEESSKQKSKPPTPIGRFPPDADLQKHLGRHLTDHSAKSAPLEKDRGFREMMSSVNSSIRNRSADRHAAVESEDDTTVVPKEKKEKEHFSLSTSFKDGGAGSSLLHNIKHSGSKAADGLGKAGKGFFGKLTRSGSSTEKDIPIHGKWEPKILKLPLVQQTRRTRISKRLEDSRDKTEFWMPALPWRCIDYLNANACEVEGIYRVPGSEKDIRYWQRRFDTEGDLDLFNETELYDINIISSMFKAWLRDLKDEILPKSTQAKIANACAGAQTTPQLLKDELSMLPPYNYYLLFAITCHISLLHSCAEKNKMDYRNLCICFQPCMNIEAFCFQFLVLDWRNCWQGCWTEDEYKVKEKEMDEQGEERVISAMQNRQDEYRMVQPSSSLSSLSNGRQTANSSYSNPGSSKLSTASLMNSERTASSAGNSSMPSLVENATPERRQPYTVETSQPDGGEEDNATPTQSGSHLRINSALPALSPIKPLSPPWQKPGRVPQ